MCDGVTQGTPGMELSLFSRDVIAMATAVSLSHDVFDAALMLGVCDKIVPGLADWRFAVWPFAHGVCAGWPHDQRPVQQRKIQGARTSRPGPGRPPRVAGSRVQAAYHGEGTCTFYGTANSNQMLLEAMGLHVPGTAFINPGEGVRQELTREAVPAPCWRWSKAKTSRPLAAWSTSAASSTPWWLCWPRAARPTT